MEEIWDEVEKGAMPLSDYLRMHPEAELTDLNETRCADGRRGGKPEFPDWD